MSEISLERSLPHSLESERSVLAACLLEPKAIFTASEILTVQDFYLEAHRATFSRMLDLLHDSRPIDLVTVVEEHRRHDELERAGGVAYLASLTDGFPRSENVADYARTVKEKATSRMLIRLGNEVMTRCYQGEDLPDEVLQDTEAKLFQIAARSVTSGFRSASDLVMEAYRQIEAASAHKSPVIGLATGFTELDRMTGGLQGGDLVILAARPGLGKTSLALNIAANISVSAQAGRVGIFSLEMDGVQLAKLRMLASLAEVDGNKLKSGFLNREDWNRVNIAAGRISKAHLWIDDAAALTMTQLRAKAQRLNSEHGLDLLIVDYLQLLASERRYENRVQEVTAISRGMKVLAKELDIPVIALSQLNRSVETRGGKRRPQLSDLRESGSIEQDADIVLFIHREEAFNPTEENSGVAEIIVEKQRNGATGSFQLAFIKQFTKFANLYQEETRQQDLYR